MTTPGRRARLGWAVLGCVAMLLAGCGRADDPASPAAEPAEAPSATVVPAGRVVPVGADPEGMVADPVTHLVAVGVRNPTTLALVDGRTGQVVTRVPLPGHLRHLQLAAPGGPVLVPAEDSGAVLTVGLPDGRVSSRVAVGKYPHDATGTADGTVAAADEHGGALVLVRDGRVVHRFDDPDQPGGLAAVGDLVAMVDVGNQTLSVYDTVRRVRTGRVPAGDGPTHVVAVRGGRLLVADTRGNRLLVFGTAPLRRLDAVDLPGRPYGLAYDPVRDRLWATLTGRNELVGLDLGGAGLREVARYPTVRQPNTVAVDPSTGRVFVASRTGGTVQLIDP